MTDWSQVLNSPFFGGSLLLMLGGSAMALLRNVPNAIYDWLKSQVMVTVDVSNSDPCFDWVTSWLHELPYSRKTRRVSASTRAVHWWNQDDDERTTPKIVLSPSPGEHLIRWQSRWLWLNRERKDAGTGFGSMRSETYTITIFGRDQGVAKRLLADIREGAERLRKRGESVYCNAHSEWRKLENYLPRSLDSVILPEGEAERVVADMREFIDSRKWYEDKGIPYRRGYLCEGIPGTGKSSLIAALSHELKLNLYTLNIADKGLSDSSLSELMNSIPSGSMVLFEDIDAATVKRDKKGKKGKKEKEDERHISLSGVLNCLDGLLANTGSMVFMTTNHPEALDEALVRPGRVDVRMRFGHAEPGQVERLAKRFYPQFDSKRFAAAASRRRMTMADVQMAMLAHKADPLRALEELGGK